ncbi:hypothetical protein LJB93_02155 [Desulfovibrio sp. OttesenSCG-928-F07]|nr:hypothetical protein [Desulfovibrio sp. OttesenSCG-928-F07]
MGVDIYLSAHCPDAQQEFTTEITEFFTGLESAIPQPEVKVNYYEDGFEVIPFFAADPVVFQFDENTMRVSARTSNAGPGYHAYVVSLLKKLEQQTQVIWAEDGEDDESGDESGYWQSGDFTDIQGSMAGWLHSLGSMIVERFSTSSDTEDLALGMPIDFLPTDSNSFAVYPLGRLELDFFKGMLSTDDIVPYCQKFFLWWNEGLDAHFYKNYGLYLMWNHINWLPPVEDDEYTHYGNAMHCFDTARKLDPQIELPLAEWYQMAALAEHDDMLAMLEKEYAGIKDLTPTLGHLRGSMTNMVGGAWNITTPGTMHREIDNNTIVMWDDDLTIRISNIRVNTKSGEPVPAAQLLGNVTEDYDAKPFSLPDQDKVMCQIVNSTVQEKGKDPYFETTLFAAVPGVILILSCYYDEEKNREHAMPVINSVKNTEFSNERYEE